MMFNKINLRFSYDSLLNFFFCFFPISFIIGNSAININVVLFSLLGCFKLKSKIIKTQYDFLIKIIFLLFLVIIFSTGLSFIKTLYFGGYEYENLVRFIKSIFFFLFFLILIIIYLLTDSNILNYKIFIITAAFSVVLVSLDVIYQYIFDFNIIGLKSYGTHNTGVFGDEIISGGYIQNFSFFALFFLFFILNKKKNIKFLLSPILFNILGLSILFSGNRMPLVLFLFGSFLIILFIKKLRKIMLLNSIFFIIAAGVVINLDPDKKNRMESIIGDTKKIFTRTAELERENKSYNLNINYEELEQHGYTELFLTAIDTWKMNKLFGNGIKSFRIDCGKFQNPKKDRICSNHPHNYYLEILTETGIVGLLIVIFIGSLFLIFIFKNFKFFRENNLNDLFFIAASMSWILEMFPIKSTGSFFSTNNAAYILLMSGIILSYKKMSQNKKV